jgi:hypothetical protein
MLQAYHEKPGFATWERASGCIHSLSTGKTGIFFGLFRADFEKLLQVQAGKTANTVNKAFNSLYYKELWILIFFPGIRGNHACIETDTHPV